MGNSRFSNRVLGSFWWREAVDWRGVAMIWGNNYFWGVGTRAWITNLKRKAKSKMKLSCRFISQHKGAPRPPLSLCIQYPNKGLSLPYSVINVSQMVEGLASSVPSDAHLAPVCNFLMCSGCSLIKKKNPSPNPVNKNLQEVIQILEVFYLNSCIEN